MQVQHCQHCPSSSCGSACSGRSSHTCPADAGSIFPCRKHVDRDGLRRVARRAELAAPGGESELEPLPEGQWNSVFLAAMWPGSFKSALTKNVEQVRAYIKMARLVNVAPSFMLVFVGAFGAVKSWSVLMTPTVWIMAIISTAIAVSSVVVNDYFDFRLGVDEINAPDKPIPRCASPRLPAPAQSGSSSVSSYSTARTCYHWRSSVCAMATHQHAVTTQPLHWPFLAIHCHNDQTASFRKKGIAFPAYITHIPSSHSDILQSL